MMVHNLLIRGGIGGDTFSFPWFYMSFCGCTWDRNKKEHEFNKSNHCPNGIGYTMYIERVPFLKSGWNKQKPSRTSRFNDIMHHVCKFQAMLKLRFRSLESPASSSLLGRVVLHAEKCHFRIPGHQAMSLNQMSPPFFLKVQVTFINIKLGISSIKKSHILTYYFKRKMRESFGQPQKKRQKTRQRFPHFPKSSFQALPESV